ncbi:MAG: hypothetical protein LPK02_07640 [Rhodobacterales bacterium]|nr:hypothetical protein [Rhodobacterales bacterium]
MLDLPLATFWLMSNNVNRISAEKDIRAMAVAAASGSEKGYREGTEGLRREMGEIYKKPEKEVVQEGLKKLRDMNRKMLHMG